MKALSYNDFDELIGRAELADKQQRAYQKQQTTKVLQAMHKTFDSASLCLREGDEEKAFILFYRSMQLGQLVANRDRSSAVKERMAITMDNLEKLQKSLSTRYESLKRANELETRQLNDETSAASTMTATSSQANGISTRPQQQQADDFEPDSGRVSPRQLYKLLAAPGFSLLIIDYRVERRGHFQLDRINRNVNTVRLEPANLKHGLVFSRLVSLTPAADRTALKRCGQADLVLLLGANADGQDDPHATNVLRSALTEYNMDCKLGRAPCVLAGGLDNWRLHYQHLCSAQAEQDGELPNLSAHTTADDWDSHLRQLFGTRPLQVTFPTLDEFEAPAAVAPPPVVLQSSLDFGVIKYPGMPDPTVLDSGSSTATTITEEPTDSVAKPAGKEGDVSSHPRPSLPDRALKPKQPTANNTDVDSVKPEANGSTAPELPQFDRAAKPPPSVAEMDAHLLESQTRHIENRNTMDKVQSYVREAANMGNGQHPSQSQQPTPRAAEVPSSQSESDSGAPQPDVSRPQPDVSRPKRAPPQPPRPPPKDDDRPERQAALREYREEVYGRYKHLYSQLMGDSLPGRKGMRNIGNSCYANATLQCLFALPCLRHFLTQPGQWLEQLKPSSHSKNGWLVSCVSAVFTALAGNDVHTVCAKVLHSVLGSLVRQFNDGRQADAQELLNTLVDLLHEETNQISSRQFVVPGSQTPGSSSSQAVSAAAAESWRAAKAYSWSQIYDFFAGQLVSSVLCATCDFHSPTFDVFCQLAVEIPDVARQTSLQTALAEHFCVERLDDWSCDRCAHKRPARKQLLLFRLPHVLVVHLKRFSHAFGSSAKVSTAVSFGASLDVADFLHPASPDRQRSNHYELVGVTAHQGSELARGHYVAYARCMGEGQSWLRYDDDAVSALPFDEVLNKTLHTAYILFYQRKPS